MNTATAIIGFCVGVISLIVGVITFFLAINVYNATGEYLGIKRYRLKNALRFYIRRTTNPKADKTKRIVLRDFRSWWISYWLLMFPRRISTYVDKLRHREIQRKEKNKRYSDRLVQQGLSGILAFAENDENDFFDSFIYRAFKKYLGSRKHANLVGFIKTNFSVHGKKREARLTYIFMSMIRGIGTKQKELAGVLLYLYFYSINVIKEILPNGVLSNIYINVYKKYDTKAFYDYFRKEYKDNISQLNQIRDKFGNNLDEYNTDDDKTTEFLMLYKYIIFNSNLIEGREMNPYIDELFKDVSNLKDLSAAKEIFNEQLELVGGNKDMAPHVIRYIKENIEE